ncbi:MAG TPA: HAD family hydrolase [Clostridiales bacterium]|nr:HAD family hydrolase [Clostridiales bacterium]
MMIRKREGFVDEYDDRLDFTATRGMNMIICFDADGTIIDSLTVESVYYVGAYKKLGIGLVDDIEDLKKLCRNNYFEECAKHGIDEATCRELGAIYRRDLAKSGVEIPMFPGAAALLNDLGKRFPLFIVSSNHSVFLQDILTRHQVGGVTEVIGGDQETSKVNTFLKLKVRYPGEKILFIGDTKGDILEGKKAGLDLLIGVTYGWGFQEDLKEAGADYLVDSVAELASLLQQITENQ